MKLEIFRELEEYRNWHDGSFKELILVSLKLIGLELHLDRNF